MTTKTRVLAGGIVRPATRLRVGHTAAPDETVTVVSRPMDAVRVVSAGPTFVEVENVTTKVALVAVVAGPSQRLGDAHRYGLLDLVAGVLGADITIMGDKK
jgi:hypothetical protein